MFNWEYNSNNDRRVREIIATLASVKPIVATSDRRGYKLAKDESDIEETVHEFREISSRIDELKKRIPPLLEFLEKHHANTLNP
jgi:DNA-binding winged helix-turn-helix (wHTH) protein